MNKILFGATFLAMRIGAEVVYPNAGNPCKTNADCLDYYEVCTANVCMHKDSWPLFT
jgi:hypothetical protein